MIAALRVAIIPFHDFVIGCRIVVTRLCWTRLRIGATFENSAAG
jgi:hypothetical protein